MKVIKSDSSGVQILKKILKEIHSHDCTLIIWQFNPETKERRISESKINSVQFEDGKLNLIRPREYDMSSNLPLYFYSEEEQVIFKSEITELKDNLFSVQSPLEIKLLDEDDVSPVTNSKGINITTVWKSRRSNYIENAEPDILRVKSLAERTTRDQDFLNQEFQRVSLDEEDRIFADKRESPRGRPVEDKHVKVETVVDNKIHELKIFDLSRGGIGLVVKDLTSFPKGSKIKILSFDDFTLDDPLIAEVMSHRPIENEEQEVKVGCKFEEGQD